MEGARGLLDSSYACPTCRKPVREGGENFPFCSKRCRWVDLGRWLDERYRVSRSLGGGPSEASPDGGEAEEDLSSEEANED